MPTSLRALSPTFIRSVELDYEAPLVTVAGLGFCANPPEVSAGNNQTVGGLVASLSATATSPCEDTLTYQWSYVSGPGSAGFSNDTVLATNVTVAQTGFYTFKIEVSDGYWTTFSTISVLFT